VERRGREDFIYEAAVLMRDRFLYQQAWEGFEDPFAQLDNGPPRPAARVA
jgi:hypothetical protein